jgi:GNAT superfamily N-acetyltransferase
MHSLASYFLEREGFDSIVVDGGFATYRVNGDECYIRDIWCHPENRNRGIATAMADVIATKARSFGCKYLTGSVDTTKGDPTASTKVLLAYGFKIFSAVQGGVFFRKDLK